MQSSDIMNGIVELESIPDVLKPGILVPVYMGSGKDPLMMDSYRGITLTSVVAEVLEFLILGRMDGLLLEAGIPHIAKPDGLQKEDLCRCDLCHS